MVYLQLILFEHVFTAPPRFSRNSKFIWNRIWELGRKLTPSILGNDADGDSEPAAPVKTVEKTSTHTAKRNTDGIAPSKGPVAGSRRGGGLSGNEAGMLLSQSTRPNQASPESLVANPSNLYQLSATATLVLTATVASPLMKLPVVALVAAPVPVAVVVSSLPYPSRYLEGVKKILTVITQVAALDTLAPPTSVTASLFPRKPPSAPIHDIT